MLTKGKDSSNKSKSRSRIRQPLIGEDVPMVKQRKCMDLWLTPGISTHFLSLCYVFLLNNIFTVIYKLPGGGCLK